MQRIVAVIPARMGSSRFPGKPLARLFNTPMIEHVFQRVSLCEPLDAVFVATCDEEIRTAVEAFGGMVIMTSQAHERASDRVAEAAAHLEADIIVMIQADEPMITPAMIEAAVAPLLQDENVGCVNLVKRICRFEEYTDPNTIKVVMGTNRDALYFSRSPIPKLCSEQMLQTGHTTAFKQVCVIPFRHDYLNEFARLAPTPLERAESIDMLRALEHGRRVRLVESEVETHAVDTPADLRLVEELMKHDPLRPRHS